MDDFKPNSYRFKEEQAKKAAESKNLQKVVSGNVKVRKRSEATKFKDLFISEDAHNVGSYILMEVLVPATKKAIADIVTNGIDMLLYGESGSGRRRSNADRVSFDKMYDRGDSRRVASSSRSTYNYDELYFETRGEAEDVLDRMREIVSNYGIVSVADLYELAGVVGNYTDQRYRWTGLRNTDVVRTRYGYQIRLPRAMVIE